MFALYGWITGIIAAGILSWALWASEQRVEAANDKLFKQKEVVHQLTTDIKKIAGANIAMYKELLECRELNASNAEDYFYAQLQATEAIGNTEIARNALEKLQNEISIEITDTEECRTMVDPFPDSFASQLCVKSGANCSSS